MALVSLRRFILRRGALLVYSARWTALLTATVAVASFSPEVAFVWAASPSSSYGRACGGQSGVNVRVLMEGAAGEVVCVPAGILGRSKVVEAVVPSLFAALVVAGSACFVRAVDFWEEEEEEDVVSDQDLLDRRL